MVKYIILKKQTCIIIYSMNIYFVSSPIENSVYFSYFILKVFKGIFSFLKIYYMKSFSEKLKKMLQKNPKLPYNTQYWSS